METELKRTPLEDEHRALGAKLVEFAGWVMPVEYAGVLAEHRTVRRALGMFDLTHLGKVEVEGTEGRDWLQRLVTNDVAKIEVGQAQYNLVLTEAGGIVDDLIVYRTSENRCLLVPNAANTEAVLGILRAEVAGEVAVTHRTDLVTIAVQGPRSPEVVGGLVGEASDLSFMRCAVGSYEGAEILVARSGYTGERGYELFAPEDAAPTLWRRLLEAGRPIGLQPCGLGARDTLRLEMGYPLHGNEISRDRTPLEAGRPWACSLDTEFTGKAALLAQKERGIPARLRGLRMDGRLIPRPHYPVFLGGERVGETTSGSFSPTLRVGIALAYLHPEVGTGGRVEVDVRGRRGPAEVVTPPFVESSPR